MYSACVLVLVALLVRSTHSFSWDIVVSEQTRLDFYYNGTLTHTEDIPSSHYITSVSYDPVHYRVFFTDFIDPGMSISSFDLSTRKIKTLGTRELYGYYARVVYDPITQILFWKQHRSIFSFSLNPASPDKVLDGNVLATLDHSCNDIAVDSCGGYIYWIADDEIGRMRLDGSEGEVLIDSDAWLRISLVIDQQTQRMYWTETIHAIGGYQVSIQSANFHGNNRTTFYISKNDSNSNSLAISKNFIYWMNNQLRIWQLPKNASEHAEKKLFSMSGSVCGYCQRIATNYVIEEQMQGIKSCETAQNLIQNNSKSESKVSICHNYCLNGECSVSAEGQPKCSCKAGYFGERCEVNACHEYCYNGGACSLNELDKPVCQCTADYDGERCNIATCKYYCLQGNCSVTAEGQPKCSCKSGYSGTRCEVNTCHLYCLNGGICSLNEEEQPVCQCTADYDGERCEVPICLDYCLEGNCSVSAEGQPQCSCKAGYSGERCEVYACHDYCLNGGVCSLNEEDEPVCQCTADYEGERCEVTACKDYCVGAEGTTKSSCDAGISEERKVSACHHYCLNDGICSLDEKSEPVCQCPADYEGERCDVPAFLIKCFLYAYKKIVVSGHKGPSFYYNGTLVTAYGMSSVWNHRIHFLGCHWFIYRVLFAANTYTNIQI